MNSSSPGFSTSSSISLKPLTPQQAADLAVLRKQEILSDLENSKHLPNETEEEKQEIKWAEIGANGLPIIEGYLNDNIKEGYKSFLPQDLVEHNLFVDASNLEQVKIVISKKERDAYIVKMIDCIENKLPPLFKNYEELGFNRFEAWVPKKLQDKLQIIRKNFTHEEKINKDISALQNLFIELQDIEKTIQVERENLSDPEFIRRIYNKILPEDLVEENLKLDFSDPKLKKINFDKSGLQAYFLDKLSPVQELVKRLTIIQEKMGWDYYDNKISEYKEDFTQLRANLSAGISEKVLKKKVEFIKEYSRKISNLERNLCSEIGKRKNFSLGCLFVRVNKAIMGEPLENLLPIQWNSAYILGEDGLFYAEEYTSPAVITKEQLITNDPKIKAELWTKKYSFKNIPLKSDNISSKNLFSDIVLLKPQEQKNFSAFVHHVPKERAPFSMRLNPACSMWHDIPKIDFSPDDSFMRSSSFSISRSSFSKD